MNKPRLNGRSAGKVVSALLATATIVGVGSCGNAYDDAYYDRFFAKARPLLEQQLAASIAVTSAIIAGAWEAAGKPVLK